MSKHETEIRSKSITRHPVTYRWVCTCGAYAKVAWHTEQYARIAALAHEQNEHSLDYWI